MPDKGSSIYKWIDIDLSPRLNENNKDGHIDWNKSVGMLIPFIYDNIRGNVKILKNIDHSNVLIYIEKHTPKKGRVIRKSTLKNCSFRDVLAHPVCEEFPELVECFVDKEDASIYSRGSNHISLFKCPLCGAIRKMHIYEFIYSMQRSGTMCKKCSDNISYPNKFMMSILQQLNVKFKAEYSPEWIAPKLYDFYFVIDDKEYIVEMDGAIGHGHKQAMSHSVSMQDSIENDLYKDNIAMQHGIKVIRIDCDYKRLDDRFDYIKNNVLNSELKYILSIDDIDWNECNRFALSSFVIAICDLWNIENKNIKQIAEIMNIAYRTVYVYLKIGAKLNLCNYNPTEERRKNGRRSSIPINVYKDEVLVATFSSITECVEKSLEIFGIQFSKTRVCAAYKSKACYKGFLFESAVDNTKLLEMEVA